MSLIDSFTELKDYNSDQEEAATNNQIKGIADLSSLIQDDYVMVDSSLA